MRGLTAAAIARAVKGKIYRYEKEGWTEVREDGGPEAASVVTDSRKVEPGSLFAAIRGQRTDGHRYIAQCVRDGAGMILAEELPEEALPVPVICTEDTLRALRDLAEYYLAVLDIPTVGIIGSVGKTSTKEAAASVLSQKYHILKTEGNFNNELGVPLTVFRLREEHEMAVLEMGINHFGEMTRLARIVRPRTVIMTNIGFSHIEFLGSQEGILRAKSEVFAYLAEDGCAVLNADDPLLASLADRGEFRKVFYGIGPGDPSLPRQVWADQIEPLGFQGSRCMLHTPDDVFPVTIPMPGRHNVSNALAAAAAGWVWHLTPEQICEGIRQTGTLEGRFHVLRTDRLTIIDDCYNASPASMEASLDLLRDVSGRKAALLGDMGELGPESSRLHEEVGAFAASEGRCDVLYCVGEDSRRMAEAAAARNASLPVKWYPDLDSLLAEKDSLFHPGDTVLVKASHFMHFEKAVQSLAEKKE